MAPNTQSVHTECTLEYQCKGSNTETVDSFISDWQRVPYAAPGTVGAVAVVLTTRTWTGTTTNIQTLPSPLVVPKQLLLTYLQQVLL